MRLNFLQNLRYRPAPSCRELGVFTSELKFLLGAGIPLLRSLSIIERQMSSRRFKASIGILIEDVSSGLPLSSALDRQKDIYPDIFVKIVAAGEGCGIVEKALSKAAGYFEMKDSLKKKVVGALIYPSVVLTLSFAAVILIAAVLIPTMNGVFASLGIELPLITRVVGTFGEIVSKFWIFIIALLIIGYYLLKNGTKKRFGEDIFERMILSMPIIGVIRQRSVLSNISSTLSSLLFSGVPLMAALSVASAASGSGVYRGAFSGIIREVESGGLLSKAMERTKLFPGSFCEMISVGESTAKLDVILADLGSYYEREVESQIKLMTSLVEPLSTLFVGGVVAIVVFSLFSPILSIVDALAK